MIRTKFLFGLMAAWALLALPILTTPALAQQAIQPIPPARTSQADLKPAVVESLTLQARVAGHNATTQVEIVLRNPNNTVIESALQFPLREGQSVTGFALQSLDRSRFLSAAPVEKSKGQAVLEQIVREGADPALLEKTAGNHFKLRVYPIPPNGTRTVRLEIGEFLLPGSNGRLQYQMPQMLAGEQPRQTIFNLELVGVPRRGATLSDGLKSAVYMPANGSTRLTFSSKRKLGRAAYAVSWASQDRVFTDYGRMDDEAYFHAQVPLSMASASRKLPNPITLIWDSSGSGRTRDHAREFAFLDAMFRSMGDVKVNLVQTHVVDEPRRNFEVSQGNWDELRKVLETVSYDGATNPASWSTEVALPRNYTREELAGLKNLTLVFSDGIGNWGHPVNAPTTSPLYAISASAGANTSALRALAQPTGGQLIDLLQTPVAQAVSELTKVRARLVRMSGVGVDQLVSVSPYAEGGVIQIAGHMTRGSASVTLEFALPNGSTSRQVVALEHPAFNTAQDVPTLAAQRWATLRIAQLETNARLHQAEILRLGSEFGVVSSRTSLIILERLEDYLRFDVMPSDPEWRDEFRRRAMYKTAQEAVEQSKHLEELVEKFGDRVAWWDKSFPKGDKPEAAKNNESQPRGSARPMAMAPAPAPAAARTPAPVAVAPPPAPVQARTQADASQRKSSDAVRDISVKLQKQQLSSAYALRLRDAAETDRYAIYLDEKTANATNAAFYLDASEIFFEKGQPKLGLRVLSNLAEIELEDRALLRILAYRLQQAKQYDQAIELFKQVLVLAPNEPQSWRDLGLAYAANGQMQEAIDALWTTASRKWHRRFADVGLIALGELNAIAASTKGLDLSRVDPRLVRNLPVDLRVVMGWDADNTDIDLWVKDPNGEDAYYGHQLTHQGGRMSRDFTGGYGPEEFLLKVAKPGRYEVHAKFYGSRQQRVSPYTTVMLRFVTGFGTNNPKEQSVIMRLPDKGAEVLVGTFDVEP